MLPILSDSKQMTHESFWFCSTSLEVMATLGSASAALRDAGGGHLGLGVARGAERPASLLALDLVGVALAALGISVALDDDVGRLADDA